MSNTYNILTYHDVFFDKYSQRYCQSNYWNLLVLTDASINIDRGIYNFKKAHILELMVGLRNRMYLMECSLSVQYISRIFLWFLFCAQKMSTNVFKIYWV